MANTHIVLRNFVGTSENLSGRRNRGSKIDGTDVDPKYLDALVKAGFIKEVGAKDPKPAEDDILDAEKENGGENLGSLEDDESGATVDDLDAALAGDSSEDDEGGDLVEQDVISDTPITAAIEAVADGDKDGLKAIIDANDSDTSKSFGFDNMKKALLEEFAGK